MIRDPSSTVPQMPIMCASFLGDTGSVVLSGRRPFFYVYDAISGNVSEASYQLAFVVIIHCEIPTFQFKFRSDCHLHPRYNNLSPILQHCSYL